MLRGYKKLKNEETLNCLIQSLIGYNVIVDLQNETSVRGIITSFIEGRYISLEDCEVIDGARRKCVLNEIVVKTNNVRFIHIPEEISVRDHIAKHTGLPLNTSNEERSSKK